MWDLIVSVPDHCLSFYFALSTKCFKHVKTPEMPDRMQRAAKETLWPINLKMYKATCKKAVVSQSNITKHLGQ